MPAISPSRMRSSGMCATPRSATRRGEACTTDSPEMVIWPESMVRSPTIDSTSSVWPLPCTPATATISPARTSSDTPLTAICIRSSITSRSLTLSTTSPGFAGPLDTSSSTSRPTIKFASSLRDESAGFTVPATVPRRSTVIRSATSSTSPSLCVINMTDVPLAAKPRMILNKSCVSAGVRTADGSSSTRMSLLR